MNRSVALFSLLVLAARSFGETSSTQADVEKHELARPVLVRGLRKLGASCFPSELPQYHIEDSSEGLVKVLSRPEPMARIVALNELAQRGTEEHLAAILPLLDDPDGTVRYSAVNAINHLVRDVPRSRTIEARSRALDTARKLFRENNKPFQSVRLAALLAAAGDPSGYQTVLDGLHLNYPPTVINAVYDFLPLDIRDKDGNPVNWVKPLARILNDTSYANRGDAVGVLERVNSPAARAVLWERLKREKDIAVRMSIKNALWPPPHPAVPDYHLQEMAG